MKVFLTGASGFIGSYVLRRLLERGDDVAVLLRSSRPWRIEDVIGRASVIVGDLAKPDEFAPALVKFAPHTVLHVGWSGVQGRYRNDEQQLRNVENTVALLQTAKQAGARHFVGLGSQAEYGPRQGIISESAPTRPTTLYGTAKLAACHAAEQSCRQSGIRFSWLRLFSAYGPRDDGAWMVPSTILALIRGERPKLTKGEQIWDYIHAGDAAAAIAAVAAAPTAEGVFNLGSGETASIRSIVERIRDLVAPGAALGFGELDYRPDQVMHLEADISRLRSVAGWKPRVSLADGLRQTVEWFRENLERYPQTR